MKVEQCSDCPSLYFHNKFAGLYSGMIMKTSGNYYCTKSKRHKKLKRYDVFKACPTWCVLKEEEGVGEG
jgi:hypothetical protein